MIEEAIWGLLPLSLLVLGVSLLWYRSWRRQRRSAGPFLKEWGVFTVLGWSLLLVGSLAIAATTALFFSPIMLMVGAIVIISGIVQYRRSEVRYLVWSLAMAAKRDIPLEKAARAFASERGDGILAAMARRLAEYLDAGMPLSVAMARSGVWGSADMRLAADLGQRTGSLGASLESAVDRAVALDNTLGSTLAKFTYLSWIVTVIVGIVTFLMLKIIPTFQEMFEEFGLELPTITHLIMYVSRLAANYWYLLFPLMAALIGMTILGLLSYIGVPVHQLPIIRHFARPVDNARILGLLAVAVQKKRSIPESLLLLASLAPYSWSRERLASAAERIEGGQHWPEALRHCRLISQSQAALLQAAERTGNLGWALEELADAVLRRTALRAQATLHVVFPACLIAFGICVLLIAAGILMPLFSLIGNLA